MHALVRWRNCRLALVVLLPLAGPPSRALAGEPVTLKGHTRWIGSVAFAPDSKTLATASSDGTVKLWDMKARFVQATLDGHAGEIRSVAFDPEGKIVAAGTRYGTVCVWDAATGRDLISLSGHAGDVWAVAFAPDGKTL